ncbi:ubiquitin-specific protease 13 [Actinidia rufa]|uniref:Ubiquitin-specific protease 13 n=1 Tax=Actinidia rufa TaxID=165716 RepID=A0A7J0FNP5_9ERIC|nr:ubiquitin-specific protease 13 [Actinidia rufa]
MSDPTDELEPLFDYSRVQPCDVGCLDDDCSDSSSIFSPDEESVRIILLFASVLWRNLRRMSSVSIYDVVERVASHLGLDDPSKIRLVSHNCYSQQPKPHPIKYREVERLSDMLVHYNQTSDILYYEVENVDKNMQVIDCEENEEDDWLPLQSSPPRFRTLPESLVRIQLLRS